MQVKILGKEKINLEKNDYVTEGGEGQIYKKNKLVFKIYTDLSKMVPEGKIKELQELNVNDQIIVPLDILLDSKGKVIGFTMKEVIDSSPLCQLFTNSFRDRNYITEKTTMELVENIQKGIEFVHSKDCLLVDVNELNFLVSNNGFTYPWFIDTNSYKTRSFPPTAIMPSVRDYSTKDFTRLTDWYSFAILAFQLFVGIHPYKGKHPDYSSKDLIERMKNNISVFDSKVSLPKAVRDFSYIPSEYMKWFKDLFVDRKRVPPPSVSGLLTVIQVATTIATGTDKFIIKLEKEYENDILGFKVLFGSRLCLTKDKIYIGKTSYPCPKRSIAIITPKTGKVITASIDKGILKMECPTTGKSISGCEIQCDSIMDVDHTLYVKNEGKLIEIVFVEINDNLMASPKIVADIMVKSSIMFNGCVHQNILGKCWFAIPTPGNGTQVLAIPELDGHRMMSAKYERFVLVVSSFKGNKYYKTTIRFDKNNFKVYDTRLDEDVSMFDINFTVLDNGLVISIINDGELEMFVNTPNSNKISIIQDPVIEERMTLCRDGQQVLFYKENKLFSLKTK